MVALGLIASCSQTSSSSSDGSVSSMQVCNSFLQADLIMNTLPIGQNPDQTKFFANALLLPFSQARSAAPSELAPHLDHVISSINQAIRTGDRLAADANLNQQLAEEVAQGEAWVHQNCGFHKIDARGFDYFYEGIPLTIPQGYASFAFTNRSAAGDDARLTIYRERSGVNLSTQQLIAMSESKLSDVADVVVEVWAPPGRSRGVTAILIPGNYVVIDFNGTPPHAERGMVTIFTAI
jgi:hypothetical protein